MKIQLLQLYEEMIPVTNFFTCCGSERFFSYSAPTFSDSAPNPYFGFLRIRTHKTSTGTGYGTDNYFENCTGMAEISFAA
jgi:hypothetical protein